MASNLSTIGFVFDDEDGFRSAMMACAEAATVRLPCLSGNYGIWRSRTGAEVWFHLAAAADGTTEIFGLTPFFEGQSEVSLKITGAIEREGDSEFEGAMTGWVSPDQTGEGSYPVVFDAVDFAAHNATAWPAIRRVRLSGFAREMQVFATEDATMQPAVRRMKNTPSSQHMPSFPSDCLLRPRRRLALRARHQKRRHLQRC
jgi:hypothetical protein